MKPQWGKGVRLGGLFGFVIAVLGSIISISNVLVGWQTLPPLPEKAVHIVVVSMFVQAVETLDGRIFAYRNPDWQQLNSLADLPKHPPSEPSKCDFSGDALRLAPGRPPDLQECTYVTEPLLEFLSRPTSQ